MINKKAPKDMTATEFVDFLINGNVLPSIPDDDSFIAVGVIKGVLEMPAPNPFTQDQLAVMREYQRDGILFAAMDYDCAVHVFSRKPYRYSAGEGAMRWILDAFDANRDVASEIEYTCFLNDALSPDDTKPLCFADYAPLE